MAFEQLPSPFKIYNPFPQHQEPLSSILLALQKPPLRKPSWSMEERCGCSEAVALKPEPSNLEVL